jgi:hypothetical protein
MFGSLRRRGSFLAVAVGLCCASAAGTQGPPSGPRVPAKVEPSGPRVTPKLEAVAETRLLMEGLAHTNFRGVERMLREKPADVQTWKFARGQALLIAETANLLMLRPPRNQGQPVWFERAMDLRKAAINLGQAAGTQDYTRSRAALVTLANTCNRCHQSFRIAVEITPFQEPAPPGKINLSP